MTSIYTQGDKDEDLSDLQQPLATEGQGPNLNPGLLTLNCVLSTTPRRLSFHLIYEVESNSKRIHKPWLFMCVLLLMVFLVPPRGHSFSHAGLAAGRESAGVGGKTSLLRGQGWPPAGGGLP